MELHCITSFEADNELEWENKTCEQENGKFNAHYFLGSKDTLQQKKKKRHMESLVLWMLCLLSWTMGKFFRRETDITTDETLRLPRTERCWKFNSCLILCCKDLRRIQTEGMEAERNLLWKP
jgi:hypothetical protein